MEQLKKLPIWICWNCKEVKGRITKVPCAASGGATGTTKEYAHTWVTFDEAVAAMKKWGHTGIGFVIPEGVFFIDKDHIDPKDPIIQRLLELFPSYAECSFSGEGVHVFGNIKDSIESEFFEENGLFRDKLTLQEFFSIEVDPDSDDPGAKIYLRDKAHFCGTSQ